MSIETKIQIAIAVFGAIPSYIVAWVAYKKSMKRTAPKPTPIWSNLWRYIFVIGILFTIAVIAVPIISDKSESLEVTISAPADNFSVSQEVFVEGYTTKNLTDDQYLYIIIEHGGRWWPQCDEIVPDYSKNSKENRFNTLVKVGQEEESGKTFIIRAVLVESTVHSYFQDWFQECSDTGEWHGISVTEVNQLGVVEPLDYVTVIRK